MTASLENTLTDWLPRQRWFAGKGHPIDALAIRSETDLGGGLRHLVLEVHQNGEVSLYQHLMGEDFPSFMLRACASGERHGPLGFHGTGPLKAGLAWRPLGAEQSNSSFIYGRSYIGKVFRLLTPGPNPDLELTRALSGHGQVPELHGWFEMELSGVPTTLGMVSQFLDGATDGWRLATTTADFTEEARALGAATAQVHRDLAAVFGVSEHPAPAVRALARTMQSRLDAACAEIPALRPYEKKVAEAFADLASHGGLAAQRAHGDYHLGQVMRTAEGWRLLDFEGEPSKTLEERRAPVHPLRDVAGMLRSFDYASHYGHGGAEWARGNRAAFCAGYAEAGGVDPAQHPVVLRAFEYEKAVYEVVYEARNRPDWLHIPLGTFA